MRFIADVTAAEGPRALAPACRAHHGASIQRTGHTKGPGAAIARTRATILPLCDHAVMSTSRFDALNALKVRWESSGQEWSRVEDVADDLGESMSAIERVLDPCLHEGLVEQRGTDQDPEYKLTRSGDMYVTDGS